MYVLIGCHHQCIYLFIFELTFMFNQFLSLSFLLITFFLINYGMAFHKDFQNQCTVNTIVELCAIRDDVTECGVLSRADACKLIDLISLQ